jgi:peroxiredoxin Q/BCP
MPRINVGDTAPDFTLSGVDGRTGEVATYSLAAHRGAPVVLVFYPADNSPVCTVQLTSYTESVRELEGVGAQVLALSPQDLDSHRAFAKRHGGFAFPLLCDVDKAVGEAYGILGPLGFYRRSLFVVAPDGRVSYAHRSVTSLSYQPTEVLVEKVREASR